MAFELNSGAVLALLNSQSKLDRLMPTLVDLVLDLTGAERGFLMLRNDAGDLTIDAARGVGKKNLKAEEFQGSNTIVNKVLEQKKPLYVPFLPVNADFGKTASVKAGNLQSAICIPLWRVQDSEELMGLLYVDSSSPAAAPLDEQTLQLMQGLANHVAISIQNAKLFSELEEKNAQIAKLNEQLEGKLVGVQALLENTQQELGRQFGMGNIIGQSTPMQRIFRILEKVVETDAAVLIQGESGTGKELIARYLHYHGARSQKPMVSVNCAAFSETLLESELFGHRKGAFTGADQNKMGLFQIADTGTLFLDEVGEMSMEMQKKFLRVLQNGEVRPVGSKEDFHVNVRIIAATNKDLKTMCQEGKFREDLYFRLNVIQIQMPALRERREDIPLLVEHFTQKISEELKRPHSKPSAKIMDRFQKYDWPGNIRELENELRRVFILDDEYQVELLQSETQSANPMGLEAVEKKTILKALETTGGNKTRAAEILGIPLRTLYERLKKHNIS